jgi:hypothetical protein
MPPCDALQWELPSKETMLKSLDKNLDGLFSPKKVHAMCGTTSDEPFY